MLRIERSVAVGLIMCAWLASARSAQAHAGPQVRTILFEGSRDKALLVANRGFIFGDPARNDWQLMCNEALGISTSERPDVVFAPDHKLFATTSHGLLISDDHGCNWRPAEGLGEGSSDWNTPALAQHPSDPNKLYLSTFAPSESGLRTSSDGGKTWRRQLMAADTEFLRYIRFAPSDAQQLYVSKTSFGDGKFAYAVMHSGDGGDSWQEHALPLNDNETDLELLAVSPNDPEFLLAKAQTEDQASMPERLLVSRDGGASFESPLMLHVITAVAWSADTKTIWLACDDGLYQSTDAAHSFTRVGEADLVSCVTRLDDQLLACGWYNGLALAMPGIGASNDEGQTFSRWMGLNQVLAPLACHAGDTTQNMCAPLWVDWQREILGPTAGTGAIQPSAGAGGGAFMGGPGGSTAAAGSGGAGGAQAAGGASAEHPKDANSCGCQTGTGGAEAGGWAVLLGYVLRRRRPGSGPRGGFAPAARDRRGN